MEFRLPELGEGVHEGELVKWKIKAGDVINYDQPLCEIMTDKATIEVPSAFKGKVAQLHAKEGEVVKVGQLMCSFEGSGAATGSASSSHAPSATPPTQAATTAPAASPAAAAVIMPTLPTSPATRPLAAPSTRKFARESGVDLSIINGSGPNGRILKDDVLAMMNSGGGVKSTPKGISQTEERMPFMGLRKKIAEKMRISKDKAAHFTYVEEADVTGLVKLRAQAKSIAAANGVKLTYLPFVMKAMVAALKKYPILNSTLDESTNELVIKHYYNIGLSVQTDDGLTAPVIKNIESKSVFQIAKDIEAVVERARNKKLTMDDLTGGTITLTNVGSIGGLFATPVINFPEVAILGFNKIEKRPIVKSVKGEDKIVIRDMTYFSISLDHRIVDGAIGAYFIKEFIQYIEEPSLLLLDN